MHINLPSIRSRGAAGGRRRGQLLAVAGLACAGVLVSACGSSKSTTTSRAGKPLNTSQVASSIEETVLKERNIKVAVVCPNQVLIEKGKTFECLATSKNPKPPHNTIKTPFVVTIQTNQGYVTYVGK